MDYNKFWNLLYNGDKTNEELAEIFDITVEEVNEISCKLFLLETVKLDGAFGHRNGPLDPKHVKSLMEGLVQKKLMTIDELAKLLGVTPRHIRRLCNSVESSKFDTPKELQIDTSVEAIARAEWL